MIKSKILALILAGGTGGRLETLTENRAKPVMPFGGFYRLIDFALSNCAHSGISDVWVIEQYELHTLNEHLSNGRPWDLDRTYGGLLVLPPFENKRSAEGGFATGNADAIYRHRQFIRSFGPDILIVLSADHIYKLDFRDVIKEHLKNKADVTMVTTRVPPNESASRFGVVKIKRNGRIEDFQYKPESPESELITTEVFVYDAPNLLETLDKLAADGDSLKDFGPSFATGVTGAMSARFRATGGRIWTCSTEKRTLIWTSAIGRF
jgi:glucose-1-phosphate adenylyltransferase